MKVIRAAEDLCFGSLPGVVERMKRLEETLTEYHEVKENDPDATQTAERVVSRL